MAFATDTGAFSTSLAQRIGKFRAALADRKAKRQVYRTTLNELSALNDRDLNDLGIDRSMIESIAIEAAYGK